MNYELSSYLEAMKKTRSILFFCISIYLISSFFLSRLLLKQIEKILVDEYRLRCSGQNK